LQPDYFNVQNIIFYIFISFVAWLVDALVCSLGAKFCNLTPNKNPDLGRV